VRRIRYTLVPKTAKIDTGGTPLRAESVESVELRRAQGGNGAIRLNVTTLYPGSELSREMSKAR